MGGRCGCIIVVKKTGCVTEKAHENLLWQDRVENSQAIFLSVSGGLIWQVRQDEGLLRKSSVAVLMGWVGWARISVGSFRFFIKEGTAGWGEVGKDVCWVKPSSRGEGEQSTTPDSDTLVHNVLVIRLIFVISFLWLLSIALFFHVPSTPPSASIYFLSCLSPLFTFSALFLIRVTSSVTTRSTHFRHGSFSLMICFFTMASNAMSGVNRPVLWWCIMGVGGLMSGGGGGGCSVDRDEGKRERW